MDPNGEESCGKMNELGTEGKATLCPPPFTNSEDANITQAKRLLRGPEVLLEAYHAEVHAIREQVMLSERSGIRTRRSGGESTRPGPVHGQSRGN